MSAAPPPGPDEPVHHAVASAHAGYHAETRTHSAPDQLVDDVVTYRMLSPHLMRALLFLVAPTVMLLFWLLLGYLASMSSPSVTGDLITSVLGFAVVVLYLLGVAAFFAPAKEPIAEWSRLVEGGAGTADAVSDRVRVAAAARRSPAEVRPSSVGGVPVLVFRQRAERAMLLVQPYGEDLYVGWTMWRSRSTATLLGHFLRDTFGRFAPAPLFSAELRAAATRAMRESVHSLAREGVAVAEAGWTRPAGYGAYGGWRHEETPWTDAERHDPSRSGVDRSGMDRSGVDRSGGRDEVYRPTGGPGRGTPWSALSGSTQGWSTETQSWTTDRDDPGRGDPVTAPRHKEEGREEEGWGPPPRER